MPKAVVVSKRFPYQTELGTMRARRGEEIEVTADELARGERLGALARPNSDEAKAAANSTVTGRAAPEGGEPAHGDVLQDSEPGTRTVAGRAAVEAAIADDNEKDVVERPTVVHGETPGQGSTSRGSGGRSRAAKPTTSEPQVADSQ